MTNRRRVSCGLELSHVPDLSNIIGTSAESGYDFVTMPIVNPRYEREFDKEKIASNRQGPLTRSDLLLNSNDWGSLGHSIDVDNSIEHVRKNSEDRLVMKLTFVFMFNNDTFSRLRK